LFWFFKFDKLQFEIEVESSWLHQGVQVKGNAGLLRASKENKASIHSLLSRHEELLVFRRAVWPIFHINIIVIKHL
jgi:hypothetical protein